MNSDTNHKEENNIKLKNEKKINKIICSQCNKENENDSSFCKYCGFSLENQISDSKMFCSYCGAQIKPNVSKCKYCGEWINKSSINILGYILGFFGFAVILEIFFEFNGLQPITFTEYDSWINNSFIAFLGMQIIVGAFLAYILADNYKKGIFFGFISGIPFALISLIFNNTFLFSFVFLGILGLIGGIIGTFVRKQKSK